MLTLDRINVLLNQNWVINHFDEYIYKTWLTWLAVVYFTINVKKWWITVWNNYLWTVLKLVRMLTLLKIYLMKKYSMLDGWKLVDYSAQQACLVLFYWIKSRLHLFQRVLRWNSFRREFLGITVILAVHLMKKDCSLKRT